MRTVLAYTTVSCSINLTLTCKWKAALSSVQRLLSTSAVSTYLWFVTMEKMSDTSLNTRYVFFRSMMWKKCSKTINWTTSVDLRYEQYIKNSCTTKKLITKLFWILSCLKLKSCVISFGSVSVVSLLLQFLLTTVQWNYIVTPVAGKQWEQEKLNPKKTWFTWRLIICIKRFSFNKAEKPYCNL